MSRMTSLSFLDRGVRPGAAPARSRSLSHPRERVPARIAGARTQLLLDAQELIVLRHAVGARQRSGLDLARVGADREIGDGDVLGLAGAMGDDRRIPRA